MAPSTDTDPPISTLGVCVDPTVSVKGNIRAVQRALNTSQTYDLGPPLSPMDLRGRCVPAGKLTTQTDSLLAVNAIYRPGAEPNGAAGNRGLTALFSPNDEQSRRIQGRIAHLARQEQENVVLAETNQRLSNTLANDIDNPSSLPSGSGKKQSGEMKLTAESMEGRLNEMLSLVQDLRDKLEEHISKLEEHSNKLEEHSHKLEKEKQDRERDVKSSSMQLDKETADRKEDVEALRRVTLLITPLHLRVPLDLARQKVLEHVN